jgi:polysaccharide biosynthesis/export protein
MQNILLFARTTSAVLIVSLATFGVLPITPARCEQPANRYILGPADQISVNLRDVKEIEFKPVRIDDSGNIDLHYVGKLRAAGLTVDDLAKAISVRLRDYINDPNVTVEVTDYGSQPVSVMGAVNKPGVYQLRGTKTLVEVLALAEGPRNDAGHSVRITRHSEFGTIPLLNARLDASGQFSTAEVSIADMMEARRPEANILVKPHDILSVPRAEMVYVVGGVRRPGGFVLGEKESLSVLQAIAMAEGLERTSAPGGSKIIRRTEDGADRAEITINIKKILSGKEPDRRLMPNDILFVPDSTTKSVAARSVEAAIQMATGVVIFRR